MEYLRPILGSKMGLQQLARVFVGTQHKNGHTLGVSRCTSVDFKSGSRFMLQSRRPFEMVRQVYGSESRGV